MITSNNIYISEIWKNRWWSLKTCSHSTTGPLHILICELQYWSHPLSKDETLWWLLDLFSQEKYMHRCSTIHNSRWYLCTENFYQLTRKCTEKAAILEYCTFSHSLWWEDKLENIGTVCCEWDGCVACYRWNEIEEEKKKGDVALQKLSEELSKLRNYVKEAHMKIPSYLSHLTDKITSLCSCYIYKDQIFSLKSSI